MAKTESISTLSPLAIAAGTEVTDAQGIDAIEQLNWSAGHRPTVHVSQLVGDPLAELGDVGLSTLDWTVNAVLGRFQIRINADVQRLVVGARFWVTSGTKTLTVTINATSVVLNATSTNNGSEVTGTANVSSTGTSWRPVVVTLSGSGTGRVRNFRIQDEAITTASSLPDPA